jgi:hypothetical protein
MTLSPTQLPQLSDEPAPEEADPNIDPQDDDLADRLAEDAPLDREMSIEVEAALGYLHERLDDDARVVLGRALDLVADRHHQVVRFVAREAVRHARAGAGGHP